ncbi:MAG: hypothetical protein AAF648_14205 [Pseudomonadota bacterium]
MLRNSLLVLVALLVGTYSYLRFIGIEPQDRRPGTHLAGEPAPLPADLATLAEPMEVHLETYPWYGIPFAVTTVIGYEAGQLFVPSLYEAVMPFPGTKYWNRVVQADPRVRLRADGKLYEFEIYPIEDDAEFSRAFAALGEKYPFWRDQVRLARTEARYALLKLVPRS